MSTISVTIIKSPVGVVNASNNVEFTEQGGTIGRASDNYWVLEDPERFISGVHVQIVFEHGSYYLIDRSTNGAFHNGSLEPIGKGNRVPLKDQDQFSLGDYEFSVSLESAAAAIMPDVFAPSPSVQDAASAGPFADLGIGTPQTVDPLAMPVSPADDVPSLMESPKIPMFGSSTEQSSNDTDPLALLGGGGDDLALNSQPQQPSYTSSYADRAEPLAQSFSVPNAIPEDWDLDAPPAETPAPIPVVPTPAANVNNVQLQELEARIKALELENQSLRSQLQQAQQLSSKPQAVEAGGASNSELLNALGLGQFELDERSRAELSVVAGEFIREVISGMMQVLSSRNSIKNEFRMNVTTIQPVENNPLKFSVSLEEALENMFVKQGNAYKKPVEAIREGFQSISEHQVAVLAGIRAAFAGGIERFDPEALEQRFSKYQKGGLLQVGKKAKNWDFYKEYYSELVSDMDGSFRHIFGDEFVHAYEDQLHRLALSRKADEQ